MARDGAFTSRRGSGEGSLHCHTHPAQNTENSGNELHDLLQSKALTTNDPSKRTGLFGPKRTAGWRNESDGRAPPKPNDPRPSSLTGRRKRRSPTPSPLGRGLLRRGRGWPATALSTSRRGSGEGSLHCHTHPAQNTENSGNELHDLLQSKALTTNDPSKRTVSEAPNELLGGVHESVGPARPIHEPTPHPSCSGWRKRRSPTLKAPAPPPASKGQSVGHHGETLGKVTRK